MSRWYTRPVLFVEDVTRALNFYVGTLGFEKAWHEGDGKGKVSQVGRAGCEIILCEDPKRRERARLFIELSRAGMIEFEREILRRSIPSKKSWWGYDVLELLDPDGNQLLFPFPVDEANHAK
jgi:catechol 2,3-dioxygenase-like lactoylglutathione lyase family enzyme